MIIQALRDIQDRYGYLPKEELKLVALRVRQPLYRVQEVASFFPHFRLTEPPSLSIHVCDSMTCHLRGAADLLNSAQEHIKAHNKEQIAVAKGVSCLGRCDRAPVVSISRHAPRPADRIHDHLYTLIGQGSAQRNLTNLLDAIFAGNAPTPDTDRREGTAPPPWQIDVYHPHHSTNYRPYEAVRRFLENRNPDTVQQALETASLFGMGGAAARVGVKWSQVREAAGDHKYIVCNGDESEPGTFKDRELLLHTPHLVVEGMLLAGLFLSASPATATSLFGRNNVSGYVYIRHEYGEQIEAVRAALRQAQREVPEACRICPIEVFVSPGRYICGEETALLEAIEGRRAQPRNALPTIRTNGLFDKPTVVNNVETFAWVPAVVLRDQGKWYAEQLLRFFSISGDVNNPGVYETAVNSTLGELIKHAGGMCDGLTLKAVAPSGPSGGFLPRHLPDAAEMRTTLAKAVPGLQKRSPAEAVRVERFLQRGLPQTATVLDIQQLPLDVAIFRSLKLSLGAGIVVYGEKPGDKVSMLDHALNCLKFFEKESCGKCVPCRLGCQQLVHLATDLGGAGPQSLNNETKTLIRDLSQVMEATSICGLGRTASKPLLTALAFFSSQIAEAASAGQAPAVNPSGKTTESP